MCNDGYSSSRVPVGASLVDAINLAGFSASDANYHEIDRYPGVFHFPRNLAWRDLPTISSPCFKHQFHALHPVTEDGGLETKSRTGFIDPKLYYDPRAALEVLSSKWPFPSRQVHSIDDPVVP